MVSGDGIAFTILPVIAIILFAVVFALAIATIRRPESHKRLMLLADISLLEAAMVARCFRAFTGGGPGRRPGLGPPPVPVTASSAAFVA